ncbi:hypothetical protein CH352_17580 [Leptospira hartskeerlii]|uniref:DUF4105 domain-containing protein n=1 Tax=Leptospira hartskeerlii TaxID=2023177 RepID=A0A2M9XD41_9LEPT|nr:hypothetical protein CH357_11385 [Leptospira hartskeerlii]PJZ32214.1 hypothetical protein CH352_17580 [Leptospira hartskeerlii]
MRSSVCKRLFSKGRLLLLFLIFPFSTLHSKDSFLDFIYVDANTGQSSGGHSALRFDDTVIHFQYYPDEIFRVVRESYERFSYSYNTYSNRTSKIARIKISEEDLDKIRTGFEKLALIQFKHIKNLGSIRSDVQFLKELQTPEKNIKIRTFGYFRKEEGAKPSSLKEELGSILGKGWLGKLRTQIKKELNSALLEGKFTLFSESPTVQNGTYPFYKEGISSWFLPRLEKLSVLEILDLGYSLDPETIFLSSGKSLNEEEKAKLISLKESLKLSIIELLQEENSTWGHSVLVNLARFFVLEKSIQEQRLYFLVTFPESVSQITPTTWSKDKKVVEASSDLLLEASKTFREERLNSENLTEENYLTWEDLENRDWELRTGLSRGISIRNTFDRLSPDLSGNFVFSFPTPEPEIISENLLRSEQEEVKYYENLKRFYTFKLITKNCTSEIFDSLEFILNEQEYQNVLGKRIDPHSSLTFIPFIAYDSITEKWKIKEETLELSHRKAALEKIYESNPKWKTYLKESNVFSSSIYQTNPDDHMFVFFTDDVILLRPIYGIVNLGWGIGNFAIGIFTSPFDKGRRAQNGLQSAFFSLPELVFFNIRKGSFPGAKPLRSERRSEP